MSDEVVIRVENLSKKYTLGQKRNGADSGLRHALQHAATAPWRMWKNRKPKTENGNGSGPSSSAFRFPLSALPSDSQLSNFSSHSEDFWALKDVSFEVKRGEVLGIIGRNGAGKSTLLKILSRITEPTSGRIGIKGRVASLLEVGTGFHPDLTGRENIFLNGAILGMTQAEVRRKFDEIVDFAAVEKFLDTPVKHYSSGMYVRLAFAVAAHLEPEVLIVDEVLAVGDSEFQKKCLGRMKDVASGGKTVLFVSHNLPAVTTLCNVGLLLASGKVAGQGTPETVASDYLASGITSTSGGNRHGSGEYRFSFVRCDPQTSAPDATRTFTFEFRGTLGDNIARPFVTFEILDESESVVARCDTRLTDNYLSGISGTGVFLLHSPWLKPGSYSVNAYIDSGCGFIDAWEKAAGFQVDSRLPFHRAVSSDAYKRAPVLSDFSTQIELHNDKCEASRVD